MVSAALNELRGAGFSLEVDGHQLKITGPALTEAKRAWLRQNKSSIIESLLTESRVCDLNAEWTAEDWQIFYDERAGIAEFAGGFSRDEAETRAFNCCVREWMNKHPVRTPSGSCAYCGGGDQDGNRLLPHGTAMTGHTWVHYHCWQPWYEERRNEAVGAVRGLLDRTAATRRSL